MGGLKLVSAAAEALALRAKRAAKGPEARPLERVLILGYGAIGDSIFFLPALESLRAALPKARLVWVSNPAPVLDELIPATGLVDETWKCEILSDPGKAGDTAKLLSPGNPALAPMLLKIRESRFDGALMTFSTPAELFAKALSEVPLVAAHKLEGESLKRRLVLAVPSREALGASVPLKLGEQHHVARNLRLLDALGLPGPETPRRPKLPIGAAQRAKADSLLPAGAPVVGIHVGAASYNHRDWPAERFGMLARRLAEAWSGARFALVGGPDEKKRATLAAAAAAPIAALDLTGKTSLLESFALLERCALVLATDSGLAKASMALGVPTVTLWGPSSPAESGIVWEPEKHLDLKTGIECSPCSFSGMPREDRLNYLTCGHHACLAELSADWAAGKILARWPSLPAKS